MCFSPRIASSHSLVACSSCRNRDLDDSRCSCWRRDAEHNDRQSEGCELKAHLVSPTQQVLQTRLSTVDLSNGGLLCSLSARGGRGAAAARYATGPIATYILFLKASLSLEVPTWSVSLCRERAVQGTTSESTRNAGPYSD